jgi:hypothetical protein
VRIIPRDTKTDRMCRLHAGMAPKDGKDVIFPVWDPKVYEATLSLFTKFVWAAGKQINL